MYHVYGDGAGIQSADRFETLEMYRGVPIVRDVLQNGRNCIHLVGLEFPHCNRKFGDLDEAKAYLDKNGVRGMSDD